MAPWHRTIAFVCSILAFLLYFGDALANTQCTLGQPNESYMGPLGYRKIPRNKCEGGICKDELVSNYCPGGEYFRSDGVSESDALFAAEPAEGEIVHLTVCCPRICLVCNS
jgi:hypothetical protein